MRLRTRIFRRLVLFALIPATIITAVACYFLSEAIDQSSVWLSISTPDRTINSLRLAEARFQETALQFLSTSDLESFSVADSQYDWGIIIENGRVIESFTIVDFPPEVDSAFLAGNYDPGLIRVVAGHYLILGASAAHKNRVMACGFIFDREYLGGFRAATATLKESRRFQNLMPGFILFLLAAGTTILVLIIIGAYFLSRRLSASITTPLEHLTALTSAVTDGNQPQSISISGSDEISKLAETFNRMIMDLEENRKRLIAAERVAAWQEFARRMAHELKNPLTPISLSLYRIKKSLEKSGHYDQYSESIETISAEVAHLERLATDYSSLAGLPEPKIRTFEFKKLVHDLIRLYAAQLENYTLDIRIPDDPIHIEADPDHLHQVMINLIKNAMEFTPHGGKIIIGASGDERRVKFEIANEGENTREADLKAAKMPYFSTREGGTGLGLAVSEKIIIDHGGSLTLGLENNLTMARFDIPRRRSGDSPPDGVKP